ncbi:MAG: alpha/beta hydrolase [Planctomycetales bacterium]|nr:alpha/beta hydrolase [Planctomycetales bacterium]
MRLILWVLAVILIGLACHQRYRKGGFMGVLLTVVIIAVSVYIGLGLLLFVMQPSILYQPGRDYDSTPADAGLAYESVALTTPDGQTLAAWYVPAKDAAGASWTVLFCHGNAGNNSHRLDTLELFHHLGLACLIVDYRGYGPSTGKPTEKGTLLDIRAGWDWLTEQKGVKPGRIILYGQSLGGSIAAIVAKDLTPGGVVLESTFTSFVDMGSHYYPWLPVRLFARFEYDTLAAVRQLKCPVLVIHSPDDEIVPYRFGQTLYEPANPPKQFGQLAGTHNEGFYDNMDLYRQIWRDWLNGLAEAPMENEEKT